MQRTRAPRPFLAVMAAAILALPVLPVAVSAAPAAPRLDDEVAQRIQIAADGQRLPVIIEGAVDAGGSQGSGLRRAQRAESRVRSQGGQVVGNSELLGATVAELTP